VAAYRVTELAATFVTMAMRAAGELWDRPMPPVDPGHAFESFRSERHTQVVGSPPTPLWAPLSGDYRAEDGWVRLHANYPHHAAAIHRALGGSPSDSVAGMPAVAVEDAVLAAGGAAAALRTRASWLAAQGSWVRQEPLVGMENLGSGAPWSRAGDAPLAGVRVLDLTHVIAGPVCGRVLAAHGADVLHVTPPGWPVLLDLVRDTDFGKRQCTVDLDGVRALAASADVFVQSYRPGSLGFSAADLPGTVVVSLSAYGHTGPWRDRRGFDSLVQMSTGIAAGDPPVPLPAQALDHGTGWLAAYGAMTALARGGSWHVRVSLARTAEWLHDLGQGDPVSEVDPTPWLTETDSDFGRLRHIRVPGATVELSGPRHPGSDPPAWWPRGEP
jgi:crotonobetainyl-CoA:carnitine CoA-transferase CaiB-like acyl-CoA transferase